MIYLSVVTYPSGPGEPIASGTTRVSVFQDGVFSRELIFPGNTSSALTNAIRALNVSVPILQTGDSLGFVVYYSHFYKARLRVNLVGAGEKVN